MSYIKDQTGVAQTAANVAGGIVSAFAESFPNGFAEAVEKFNELREQLFADLAAVVDSDNEKFAAEDSKGSSGGSSKSSNRSSKTASSRGSKTRSSGSKRGGSKGGVSLDDALSMVLKFGAFEGETLETVLAVTTDEADDDYSYGDGERDGKDYISWLASDKNENEFVQRRARLIADEEGIDY